MKSERLTEYLSYLTQSNVKILCRKEKGLSVPWSPFIFSPLLSVTFRRLQLPTEILNEAKSLHLCSKGSPCFSHPCCWSWQKNISTSPLQFFKLVDLFWSTYRSCSVWNISALVTHLPHLSTGVHCYMEWHSNNDPHHPVFHAQLISLLLLTFVFLLSWANFSSCAASIFSKSWCFFSNSSTSDTESWMGKLPHTEVQNQIHLNRLCLRFSDLSILFSQVGVLKIL